MRPRRLLSAASILMVLAASAIAGPVVVLPGPGSATAQIYDESFQLMGSVDVPVGTFEALVTPTGDKVIFLSSNANEAVAYVPIAGSQIAGSVVKRNLGGKPAKVAKFTPDGNRLVVGTDSTEGPVFILDASNLSVVTGGDISFGGYGTPTDIVFSPTGEFAFVLTDGGRIVPIDLAQRTKLDVIDVLGAGAGALSISPEGRLFATAPGLINEYTSSFPFEKKGVTELSSGDHAGKLFFTMDGRYALAPNTSGIDTTLLLFNMTARGANNQNIAPTIAKVASSKISLQDGPLSPAAAPDTILPYGPRGILVLIRSKGAIYEATVSDAGGISLSEASYATIGSFTGVTSIGTSGELPLPEYVYVATGTTLQRIEVDSDGLAGIRNIVSPVIATPVRSSLAVGASIYGYGGGLIVPLNSPAVRYAVRLLDAKGVPVHGRPVDFIALDGAALAATSAQTDIHGFASVLVTPPTRTGAFKVRADAGAANVVIESTVETGTGGNPGGGTNQARIVKVAGNGQLIMIGLTLPDQMVARLVNAEGKPVANRQVTWSVQGGASLINPVNAVTDDKGEVKMLWNAGGIPSTGQAYLEYTVKLTSDIASTEFKHIGYFNFVGQLQGPEVNLQKPTIEERVITVKLGQPLADAIRVAVTSLQGLGQSRVPNVALEVFGPVTDPLAGTVVSCGQEAPLTDENGIATCNLIATGRTGETPITIRVGGKYREYLGWRVLATPGDPTPQIVSGDGQSGRLGALLAEPLTVKVDDGSGNIVAGTAVTWQVVTPGSATLEQTVTSVPSNGIVTTRVRLGTTPGTFQVKAIVGDKSVTFNVTAEASLQGFRLVSGNNQSAITGTQFGAPLVVEVKDNQGNAIPGVTVTFAVAEGSATLGTSNPSTNAQGLAQTTVVAGTTPGTIKVAATVPGLPGLVFNLESRIPGPAVSVSSFVSAGSGEAGLTPGGLIYIKGKGIVPGVSGQMNSLMLVGRLPYELAGFSVEFQSQGGSGYAPIYAVSNINGEEAALVQVPFELSGSSATAILRSTGGGTTTVQNIPLKGVMPGMIRERIGDRHQAIVIRSDGSVVTTANPARPGERVRMYVTGLGQTSPTAVTNRLGVDDQKVLGEVVVGINNAGVTVEASYMAPNLIGIYEVVFVVPSDAPANANSPLGFFIRTAPGIEPVFDTLGSVIAIGN